MTNRVGINHDGPAVARIVYHTDHFSEEIVLGYVLVAPDVHQPLCKVFYPDEVKYNVVQEAICLTERLIMANPKNLDELCRFCEDERGQVRLSRPMEF